MNRKDNSNEVRYCKKCGCELMSTNKKKICDNCRSKRIDKVKKGVECVGATVGGFALLVITRGKYGNKA